MKEVGTRSEQTLVLSLAWPGTYEEQGRVRGKASSDGEGS